MPYTISGSWVRRGGEGEGYMGIRLWLLHVLVALSSMIICSLNRIPTLLVAT